MKQLRLFRKTIAFGYLLIAVLIGSIAYTSFYEWRRLESLEDENRQISHFRQQIHDAYEQMIEFLLLGETILEWKPEDLEYYHSCRMAMDSILCDFKNACPDGRIDSVRHLLEDKETHMKHIVQVLDEQATLNEKIARQVPVIAMKSTQEAQKKPKRKGFLGLFGKKEDTSRTATSTMLHTLNRDIIARQQTQSRRLSQHADSLAARNGELNRQLRELIFRLDKKVQHEMGRREAEITAMREGSYLLVGGMTAFVLALLLLSYIIIHRNNNRINRYKQDTADLIDQLGQTARRNENLIASRQKVMQSITHELRTPFTAIHGYAELIPKESDAGKVSGYGDSIRQASDRMTAMLNSLLEFFRLDSGKEQLNVCPFRLSAVSDTLLREFSPQAEAKGLRLSVEHKGDAILMGDRERIMQICDNLLANAVKFTQAGNISAMLNHSGSTLEIIVEDTGSGMTEDEQSRVFNAFERLSNAATQDGFGLGLSIVKSITDMMRGTIRLESEKGKGSRFTVEIPARTADTLTDEEKSVQGTRLDRSYSVAALDDNEIVLNMVKDLYASVGVHCDIFCNVGDMMEALRTRHYDLAIVDLKMPEMNGFEVLELMRSSSVGNSKEIPVIVATASGSCGEDELLARGFTACLFKPFALSELLAVSEKCLSENTVKDEGPDLTCLLAYGDKPSILDRLITETEKDMRAVRDAAAKSDRKALDEQVHRLRSSWAVIRADKPLWDLHGLLHRDKECSGEELRRAVNAILEKGNEIINTAKDERRKPDESVCD